MPECDTLERYNTEMTAKEQEHMLRQDGSQRTRTIWLKSVGNKVLRKRD